MKIKEELRKKLQDFRTNEEKAYKTIGALEVKKNSIIMQINDLHRENNSLLMEAFKELGIKNDDIGNHRVDLTTGDVVPVGNISTVQETKPVIEKVSEEEQG